MSYLLLTGATGLLGRYLLRDALLAEQPVVVVVRPTRQLSARQRIDGLLRHWETQLGRALPRPVVFSGELSALGLGLRPREIAWFAEHCDSVLHSAASITFYAEPTASTSPELKSQPDGYALQAGSLRADNQPLPAEQRSNEALSTEQLSTEPWLTNVLGTRQLIELCRQTGIAHFHHVSTAYVCGQRSGAVREDELDVGQTFGNDYERSKALAEQLLRAATHFSSVTIYRPSIIVGDSRSGYTSTFHGFYAPLQLGQTLARTHGLAPSPVPFLEQLGLTGQERKNLVPVDWVSAVITRLVQRPETHSLTYHLTHPEPVSAATIDQALAEAIASTTASPETSDAQINSQATSNPQNAADRLDTEFFRRHMDIYRAYFRDDARFDTTNTRSAVPELPCPQVDRALLVKLAHYALRVNFGWPRPLDPLPACDVQSQLAPWLERCSSPSDNACDTDRYIPDSYDQNELSRSQLPIAAEALNLEVTGPGGGQFHLLLDEGAPLAADYGLHPAPMASCHLSTDTWSALAAGDISAAQAVYAGRLVIAYDEPPRYDIAALLEAVLVVPSSAVDASLAVSVSHTTLAGAWHESAR